MHLTLSECSERHRIAERCNRGNVMFKGVPRFLRHEVSGSWQEHDFMGCRSPTRVCCRRRGRTVGTELHPARRKQGHAGDDVVLGRIAMPADRRPGPVFVNQRHGKRIGIDAGPLGKRGAQRQQERRERRSWGAIVTIGRRRRHADVRQRHASRSPQTRCGRSCRGARAPRRW